MARTTGQGCNEVHRRVKDNLIDFGYAGKHKDRFTGITIAQAKWIGNWLARLSDGQLRDALRAGQGPRVSTDELSEEILSADLHNIDTVEWHQKKSVSYAYR